MVEDIMIFQGAQALGEQLMLIALSCCVLILMTVLLLLLSGDRTHARRYEVNSRHKLGHEPLQVKKYRRAPHKSTTTPKPANKLLPLGPP